uniref:Uncharacterized protein n=1 Tax=Lactuca sativa TaxID=4236 RepID=A0A9R1UL72_LACSA|nr:hypothetical protein LSAT_V11C800437040 [Lactuca sativa]
MAITIPIPPCIDFRKLRVTNVTPLMVHKHQEQEDEEERGWRLPKTCSNPRIKLHHTTQKDHAPSGQVHTKIVMDLDTNPTAYPRFSYYDYQDAWTKAFFIRNYSHSWFIFFDLNFRCEYPRWFINWYKYTGILPNCLPKEIYVGYLKFKELFIQQIPEFEYTLQFTMLFKVEVTFINSLPQTDIDLIARIIEAAISFPEELQKLLQEIRQTPSVSNDSPKSIENEYFSCSSLLKHNVYL